MATNNAINVPLPATASNGGTGATTLTDHGVLVGSGTSAIDALAVGSTGTLLAGSTGADPLFVSSLDGNFSFTSATAATNRTLTISNTDDTDSGSSATLQLTTGGASAGDPAVKFTVTGTTNYSLGIDNSDSDKLKISNSTALGTTDSWVMTTSGERTMPLQPATLLDNTSTSNVTGDGTVYTISGTEIYDQNSDFSSTTWTAPVSGKYLFCSLISHVTTNTSGADEFILSLVTTSRSYYFGIKPGRGRIANFYGVNTALSSPAAVLVDMDAGDTAYATLQGSGGSKNNGPINTYFSFTLIC
jgi:hypothetical protein